MRIITSALAVSLLAAPALAQDGPPPRGGMGMMRADRDGDGAVTRAEALAEAGVRFDRLDTNHDGRLTADEIRAVPRPDRPGRPDRDAPPPRNGMGD